MGALVASLVLLAIVGGIPGYELGSNGLGANGNPRQMGAFSLLLLELVMTALFLVVILGATRDDAAPGVAGIAIGGYLFVAHLVGAQLGDASLNPARSLGPALVQGGAALANVWIFIVGPIVGRDSRLAPLPTALPRLSNLLAARGRRNGGSITGTWC